MDTNIGYDTIVMRKNEYSENTEENTEKTAEGKTEKKKEHEFFLDRLISKIRNPFLRELAEWIEMLAVAAVIAFLINQTICANSAVPTGSMEKTIEAGDRVVGSRLHYLFKEPQRGDVVIFRLGWQCRHCKAQDELPAPDICPDCGKSLSSYETIYYVKRVIGLPGDRIEIRAEGSCDQSQIVSEVRQMFPEDKKDLEVMTAAVYVNGEKLQEDYLREPMLYYGDMTFEVPDNCYFMLGDNRNNSRDARYWKNSYIERERIIAKVLFRYWRKMSLIK